MKTPKLFILGAILISLVSTQIAYACISCIGGGSLAITSVPSNLDFGDTTVSTSDETISFIFQDPVLFEDMRGILIPKGAPRFSLYVTATDLVDSGTGATIDLTNMKIATDDNDTVDLVDCSPQTRVTAEITEPTAFTDSDDDGTSDNVILINGQDPFAILAETGPIKKWEKILKGKWLKKWLRFLNAYVGKYSFDPEMEITIPAYTSSGDYETTFTFTII